MPSERSKILSTLEDRTMPMSYGKGQERDNLRVKSIGIPMKVEFNDLQAFAIPQKNRSLADSVLGEWMFQSEASRGVVFAR
jgi:hypothetical protein